jgi:sigma-B regulation protein RsbU (phosphoserine phosphatase)
MQVLLVDDDPTSLVFLSAVLRKQGHEVTTARNGNEAFDKVLHGQGSIVISDWNMPKLSGPELCRKIRAAMLPHYVYFILLTVRNDKESLLEGMEAGADDFLVKPVDSQELKARLRAGERVLLLEQALDERNAALDRINGELTLAYETIKRDLATAASIQGSLLPQPRDWRDSKLDWLFIPSSVLAGDMLGYFPVNASHLAFFQIDVSGHGVSSALISFATSKLLLPERGGHRSGDHGADAAGEELPFLSPDRVIGELNRRFCRAPESESHFLTMVYGVLDDDNGRLTLSAAGHPPPLLWRAAEHDFVESQVRGMPVGVLEENLYDCEELPFGPGDRMVIYTDGIVECPSPSGELFGLERFREVLRDTAGFSLAEVKEAVSETLRVWRGCEVFPDDISMLIMERR